MQHGNDSINFPLAAISQLTVAQPGQSDCGIWQVRNGKGSNERATVIKGDENTSVQKTNEKIIRHRHATFFIRILSECDKCAWMHATCSFEARFPLT